MNQRRSTRHRSGNVLVLVAVSLIALVGVTGLVIDGGRMMAERRHAQNAADAAALAGAVELHQGNTSAEANATAFVYAGRNSYSNDGSTNTVTVNIPPASGPQTGNAKAVEVIVNRKVDTSFIRVVYPNPVSVTARSVAEFHKETSLLLLNPTVSGSLTMSASTRIDVSNGSVAVNSSSSTAVKGSGSAQLIGNPIEITGDYSVSGSSQLNGTIHTGADPTPDPLAALPAVDPNTLPLISSTDVTIVNGTRTLQPGVYLGKITLSGNASVTLQPGIYYVSGDFTLTGASSITANEVMIYAIGKFTLSGNGNAIITPPTSGTYKGITLFKDRSPYQTDVTLSGGSNVQVAGTLYAQPSKVTISGTSGIGSFGSQLIADRADISGGGTVRLSGSGYQQGVYLTE